MKTVSARTLVRALFAAVVGALLPAALVMAQPPAPAQAPAGPQVTILLKGRHGHATPRRTGCTHTGGGNTDVAQPKDDTVIITMTGVAVAAPHPCRASSAAMEFTLEQCFEIAFTDPKLKRGKLTLDAVAVGLLRGDKHGGCASLDQGAAAVTSGGVNVLHLSLEPHSVCGCENLSVNDHVGPVSVPVLAGTYTLHQTFRVSATHKQGLWGKAASAEFAPDPALDPLWISYWEPFHGAAKKDFGFRVILHVEPDTNGNP